MATLIDMDYCMVSPRKIKRKMDRLLPCKVLTVCFIVVLVMVMSLAMLNQILLVLQAKLVEMSRQTYDIQEHKAPLLINYVTFEDTHSSLPELTTPLLEDTVTSVPPSSFYNVYFKIMTPLQVPPTITAPLPQPANTNIPSGLAPTTQVTQQVTPSVALRILRMKVTTLFITSNPELRMPVSPASTDTTTPAASVNPGPYLPTVATPTQPMKDDARSERKYHVIATLVTLLCVSIILVFIVWVVSKLCNIDLTEYSREWLIESIRTIRAEKTQREKNRPSDSTRPRIVKRGSRNPMYLLDSNLNPYNSYRQACCPQSCIRQFHHHHHPHTHPKCPFYVKSVKE